MALFWFVILILSNWFWFTYVKHIRDEAERRFESYRRKAQKERAVSRKRRITLDKLNKQRRSANIKERQA